MQRLGLFRIAFVVLLLVWGAERVCVMGVECGG